MNNTARTALLVILSVLFLAGTSWGSWMDDWFDQSTTMNPSSYKGQQRNYATAGGVSARWKGTSDYPISISGPRLNSSGCGGIDLFMGSMSFVDPEYLVDKLQNIASGAAVIALQVGLKTLNEPLATAIENTEHMLDSLNQLQFDDCSTSKTLVTASAESLYGRTDGAKETLTKWRQDTGIDDVWHAGKTAFTGLSPKQAAVSSGAKNTMEGVTLSGEQVKTDYPSLLNEATSKIGLGGDLLESLIRGLVGDIDTSEKWNTNPVSTAGCGANAPGSGLMEMFVSGTIQVMGDDGTCEPMGSITINGRTYDSIQAWADYCAEKMVDNMADKSAPEDPDVTYFINSAGQPVYLAAKTYMMMFRLDTTLTKNAIGDLRRVAAEEYSLKLLDNIYANAEYLWTVEKSEWEGISNEEMAEYNAKVRKAIDEKKEQIKGLRYVLYDSHRITQEKRQVALQEVQMRQATYDRVMQDVSQRVFPGQKF
jgi:hypothetical protein